MESIQIAMLHWKIVHVRHFSLTFEAPASVPYIIFVPACGKRWELSKFVDVLSMNLELRRLLKWQWVHWFLAVFLKPCVKGGLIYVVGLCKCSQTMPNTPRRWRLMMANELDLGSKLGSAQGQIWCQLDPTSHHVSFKSSQIGSNIFNHAVYVRPLLMETLIQMAFWFCSDSLHDVEIRGNYQPVLYPWTDAGIA